MKNNTNCKKSKIGGQALMEGIMMRGIDRVSMAVRLPGGEIDLEHWETSNLNHPPWYRKIPLLRGCAALVESLKLGMVCLTKSAEKLELSEEFNAGAKEKNRSNATITPGTDSNVKSSTDTSVIPSIDVKPGADSNIRSGTDSNVASDVNSTAGFDADLNADSSAVLTIESGVNLNEASNINPNAEPGVNRNIKPGTDTNIAPPGADPSAATNPNTEFDADLNADSSAVLTIESDVNLNEASNINPNAEPGVNRNVKPGTDTNAAPPGSDPNIVSSTDSKIKTRDSSVAIASGIGLFLGVILCLVVFLYLPALLAKSILPFSGLRALFEGLIKILLFLFYILLISRMKEIRRTFGYHGAEHKSIACYEAGKALTVENVKKYSRFHPRCGTSFLFLVLLVGILLFSVFTWTHLWIRVLLKLLLLPAVVGISYELIRLAGKYDHFITRIISAPGLWLQRLTTREPDEGQIEVAIAALKDVIPENPETDQW